MTFKYVLQACIVRTIYYYRFWILKTHIKKPLKYEPSYILMIGSVLPFGVDVGNEFACIADRNPDCNMLWDASSTEN